MPAERLGVVESELQLDVDGQAAINALLEIVRERHGDQIACVLVYGSFLRGKRDTLIDLYVLLNSFEGALPARWHGWCARVLPPNVYYLTTRPAAGTAPVRSKCSVMRLDQLERAVGRDFHPYFWARFCQPYLVAYAADDTVRRRAEHIRHTAAATFLANVLPVLPHGTTSSRAWSTGFAMTYACELRPERPDAGAALYAANRDHFDRLFAAAPAGRYTRLGSWRVRRWLGRLLASLRVVKAGATFDDPIDYVVWKTARHSGVRIEPTERQRRYPLIFGWPLLWRLYRRGAFR